MKFSFQALDAFMANLERDAQKQGVSKAIEKKQPESSKSSLKSSNKSLKGVRQDIEEADDEESYYKG